MLIFEACYIKSIWSILCLSLQKKYWEVYIRIREFWEKKYSLLTIHSKNKKSYLKSLVKIVNMYIHTYDHIFHDTININRLWNPNAGIWKIPRAEDTLLSPALTWGSHIVTEIKQMKLKLKKLLATVLCFINCYWYFPIGNLLTYF